MRRGIYLLIYAVLIMPMLAWGHGSSLWFDGTDSIIVNDASSLDITDSITIETWIKLNTTATLYQSIISKYRNGNQGNYLLYTNLDECYFAIASGGSLRGSVTINADLIINKWYHLVVTFVSNDSVRFYLNGVLNKTNYFAFSMSLDTVAVRIGNDVLVGQGLNGSIKMIRIYNRRLPTSEIIYNYNHPDRFYSNRKLVLWLKIDEYTGTIVADSSGNGNNGTISGATWNIDTPIFGARCPKE